MNQTQTTTAQIERVGAVADFAPSFDDLLISEDPELMREALLQWLAANAAAAEASFVYQAWLKAGGEPALIRESLVRWLGANAHAKSACYVHSAWLEATGDVELVREPIRSWLAEHGALASGATYVYQAWLQAGGDPEFVREPIGDWLSANATKLYAAYVFQGWLNNGGEPALVRDSLRSWLRVHGESPCAGYVRRAWIEEHCDREYHSMRVPADAPVVQLVMRAAQRVGTKVETVTIGGGSDANVYNKHDITSVNLGTGMRDIHTVNEWIDLPDFYRSAEIVLECVKERAAA